MNRAVALLNATLVLTFTTLAYAQERAVIVSGGILIDGTGAEPRPGMTVVVSGDKIAAIHPDAEAPVTTGATVIDARGKYVIPGLADMHVHFSLGAPLSRQANETAEVLGRILYYGVTTVLNVGSTGGRADEIVSIRRLQSEGDLLGPHVYASGGLLTIPGSHPTTTMLRVPTDQDPATYDWGRQGIWVVNTNEDAAGVVARMAAAQMDVIKIVVESGPTPFGDNHPQMPESMIRAIVGEAKRYGLRVFAHVSSLDELMASFDGGTAGVMHAVWFRPLANEGLADQLAAEDFFVVSTLSLYGGTVALRYVDEPVDLDDPFLRETVSDQEVAALRDRAFIAGFRSTGAVESEPGRNRSETLRRHMNDVLANLKMLHDRGVPIALGTDTGMPFAFPGYSVHRELELLVRAGFTPMEAIQTATRNAARMIGREEDFGTLEPGKRADLLILDGNPLEDIRNTRSLGVVICGGRVIERDTLLEK